MIALGSLSKAILEALDQRSKLRLAGLSELELAKSFEAVVRAVWPFTREWKYLCNTCNDLGAEYHECQGDGTCGRKPGHGAHQFITACWCDKGKPFRPKREKQVEDALATVGKTSKPTRFGR